MSVTETSATAVADPLSFEVEEVTGMRSVHLQEIDGHRTAADVATSVASMLELRSDAVYALRSEAQGKMLADDRALGTQVPPSGARLVCIPKSHLG